jgi:BlaI family transcriptional regulator, penicillinase repressor
MPKPESDSQLTPLDLEVMKVLWEAGPSTVQGVHAGIQDVRPLAFNTVQTVLGILFRKGKVKRTLKDRAYTYRAAVTRDAAAGHALRDLIDRVFESRPEELVLNMVRSRQLTAAQLAELQKLVQEEGDERR